MPAFAGYVMESTYMAKKRTRTTAAQKRAQATMSRNRQLYSVVWFAVALFLMAIVFVPGENVWNYIHNFLFGMFGITTYFYPFLLGAVAVIFAMDKGGSTITAKVTESVVLSMLVGACIDIFSKRADSTFWQHLVSAYQSGMAKKSGGFLGALIAEPIYLAFGKTGAAITIILLIFVFIMLF